MPSNNIQNITVTYHPKDKKNRFHYRPTLRIGADGDKIVAELPGNTAHNADYVLVFTLDTKGATWPPGNGWITFRHGGTPPTGSLAAPALQGNQRSISIKNGLVSGQPESVYGFTLTIVYNGQSITSPDPDIVLPPPPPDF